MEYVSYILVTLGILLACLALMRLPEQPMPKKNSLARASRPTKEAGFIGGKDTDTAQETRLVLQRELMHVPTPWGWPGHHRPASLRSQASLDAQEVRGVSESVNQFVERLFSEKHTVDSQEYLLRIRRQPAYTGRGPLRPGQHDEGDSLSQGQTPALEGSFAATRPDG